MYPFLSELSAKSRRRHLLLPQRRPAQSAVRDRLRPPAAQDMARFLGDFAERRPHQHRRWLLRQHPGAHRRHRPGARRPAAPPARHQARGRRMSSSGDSSPRRPKAPPSLRLAALHPAARRLHHARRAHQRRRLPQVRQAHQGRQVRGSRLRRAPAGRKRRQRHRHLHGRRHDRRRRRHELATSSSSLSEPEVAKVPFMVDSSKWEVIEAGLKCLQGKGNRQLHLAQRRRRQVPPERPHRPQVWRRRRRHGLR